LSRSSQGCATWKQGDKVVSYENRDIDNGPSLDAEVGPHFGRCQYFTIVDPQTMKFEAVENTNAMASGGSGIATAQMIANSEAEVVLTGNTPCSTGGSCRRHIEEGIS